MARRRVARLDDIAVGAAIAVEVDGEPVALVRVAPGVVKACHNICSHQYYELAPEGWVGPNSIECALHGSEFDLDTGEPASLPALDPIPIYACDVVDGEVYVDLAAQRNDAKPADH